MNDWPAPSGLTALEAADYGSLPASGASSCGSPSTSTASSGGGMMALLLERGGAGAGGEEDDSMPITNSGRYLHSDLPPGSWGRSSPSTTLPSSSSALSSFGSYPLPVHQHQGTATGSASLGLPSSTSSPLRLSGSRSGGDDTSGPYCLPLPRPMALPSFDPMQLGQASAPSPSLPSPAATPGSSFSPFPPQMMDFLPLRSSMSSSMPDIFRPSLLFDPSTTSSASSSASSSPSYAFPLGDSGSYPSSSASSGSSSFSLTPPTHLPSSPPTLASHREQTQTQPQPSASSFASSNATTSTAAKPRSRKRSSSTTSAQHKPASSAAPLRRTASSEGQSHIRPVAHHHHHASSASSTRKPVPRRKMEEEYYHYLKEKLSRMESTRRKWQQQCMDPSAKGKGTTTTATAMFDSPESSDMSWSSPDMYASGDDFRKEEEQLYLSGAAMECFRHYYEKLWMFLSMESMQLTDEEWLRTVLKGVVCQTSPFALKINAILALGGLVSGQRQWADIFYDKWRRILTEFFDSSDYQVAEGLTVMSYYCFYQGDNARSRCYAELAAEIAVRARVGGGLMFIRAQTIIEVMATADSPSASSSPRAGTAQPLFLKKPLLTFPETVEEEMKVTISNLLEQLILASSRVHMWKSCQMIVECRERGRRSRKRRQSGGGNSSKACSSSKLPSPLHLLSVLQSIEDKLEGLEAQQRQASSGSGKSHGGAGGGRKGSVDGQQRSLLEASENTAFVGDMLAFARFVLFSVRLECHHEAGMNKNAFLSGEKILILLEKEESRLMRFVIALAPLVLSFVSPVLELFCGPLHGQFLNASDSIRAVTLLRPLREIFPTISQPAGLVVAAS